MGTCDSCKTAPASVFCRADSAFLCADCDSRIHSANKLASRHARVRVCDVCERAPAVVACKADAAVLCAACDGDIHSANPLARRHQRLPIVPFHGPAAASAATSSASVAIADDYSEEEAEAASWILTKPNGKPEEVPGWAAFKDHEEFLFSDSDPFLDPDFISVEQKPKLVAVDERKEHSSCDRVVPVQTGNEFESGHILGPAMAGFPSHDVKFPMYNFTSQFMSQSVSSSSLEVPDHKSGTGDAASAISGMDREARVLRYREKRKSRKFEKTIRYASRKAYAETRPRIKGRFAKRSELDIDSFIAYDDASFCLVPTF